MKDPRGLVADLIQRREQAMERRDRRAYPGTDAEETQATTAFQLLFERLADPRLVVRHPKADLLVELNPLVGPRLSFLVCVGDYEQSDLDLLARHVVAGDQVLELGAGIGLTAALSAKLSGRSVTVIDADQRLAGLVQRQAQLNGGEVIFEMGCVVANAAPPARIDFFLADEVWFSSATLPADARGLTVSVPTVSLASLLARHRPTVLMVDIEGDEQNLFAEPLPWRPKKILIEIHTPQLGETETARIVQQICAQGYRLADLGGWTHVFVANAPGG
jgi:FkbM family methyltransferase